MLLWLPNCTSRVALLTDTLSSQGCRVRLTDKHGIHIYPPWFWSMVMYRRLTLTPHGSMNSALQSSLSSLCWSGDTVQSKCLLNYKFKHFWDVLKRSSASSRILCKVDRNLRGSLSALSSQHLCLRSNNGRSSTLQIFTQADLIERESPSLFPRAKDVCLGNTEEQREDPGGQHHPARFPPRKYLRESSMHSLKRNPRSHE